MGNGFVGICTNTKVIELESILIAVPTVLGELRCGHITSVYFGMGWRELFWEECLAVVPCATADEESGSNLKLGILYGSTTFGYKRIALRKIFLNEPMHKN